LTSAARADVLAVRADPWPPFNDEPGSALPGYAVEVMKAVFEPLGHTIDYQKQPWSRALADIASGKNDAIIGAASEECPTCVLPKESIAMIDNYFYVKKGNPWKYQNLDSLKSVKIGTVDEYDYGVEEFNKYVEANKTTPAVQPMTGDDALQKNLQKLLAGRIDATVECKSVVAWTLKKMQVAEDSLAEAGMLGEPTEAFIAFAPGKPNSQKYADAFDQGMQKLRASGELQKILDKYGVEDWKK